ncbi:FtsX-like permease family protein [Lysinibacillus sp. KU-BSD001]|uniref:FtsX-like permease family protein n=1 Tax=Lysinibacillus sp. KU-BSD001 TaxID=3141328 RepID=UPI0036E490D0
MFNLKAIALKLFRAASTQIMTSISIITVSVCLILTMSMYIWNAKAQMQEEIYALFGEAEMFAGYNPEQAKWVTSEQLTAITAMDGVTGVSPILLTHTSVEGQLDNVYTIGVENDDLVKSRYHFNENIEANEVVISEKIAQLSKKQVGDTIDIESNPYIVKEILTPLPNASDVKAIILANDTVRNWLTIKDYEVGVYTLIDIDKSASPQHITELLQGLDNELRIDIVNEYDFAKQNFQALSIFIIVLSVFVLLITVVLLISTFQLVFYKLKEQLMVLRALGATKHQVGQIVQTQLMTILTVGLLSGVLSSLAVIKLWLPFLVETMQLPAARTEFPIWLVLIITAAIFVILQVVIQWQVRKSMRLLPLQIATDNYSTALRLTKGKRFAMSLVFGSAMLCFLPAMVGINSGERDLLILIGSLLMSLIILYTMPYIFTFLLKIGIQPVRILLGKEAYLACQQLMPQVRKNMPIVLSIIGLMVILIFGTTLFKSVQENEKDYIDYLFETPIAIKNDLWDPTFPNEVVKDIEALPSVDFAYARSNNSPIDLFMNNDWIGAQMTAVDIEQLIERGKIDEITGDIRNGMIVTTDYAALHELTIGDEIRLGVWNNAYQSVDEISSAEVVAIVEPKTMGSEVYLDWSSEIVQTSPYVIVTDVMVQTAHIQQTLNELSFLHEQWPALTFSDYDTYMEENNKMFYQRWSLFVGVLVVLIVATCLGVIQTLLHTIYSKRVDYATQRLVGLSPNGLMKLILSQVLLFVVYGLVAGSIIGTTFTKLLALVDVGSEIVFNVKILLVVSLLFLFTILAVFSLQSYWISRKKLADELVE